MRSITGVENHIHFMAVTKKIVAAVFGLVDRITIIKFASLLLVKGQGETKTGRINPTLADLFQSPYSERVAHGICDPSQVCDVIYIGKTISFFSKGNVGSTGSTGHVFMSIKDNPGVERWMRTKSDHYMSPFGIDDMKKNND